MVAIGGELKDEVYKVYDGENAVGRMETGRVVLKVTDRSVSREHAVIIHQNGTFGIKALKPDENPTYVDGEKIEGAMLSDGAIVKVGSVTLKFRTL